MRRLFWLSSLLIMFNVNSEVNNLYALSLEELLDVEVSVSTRNALDVFHAPASVSVFTSTQIQQMGISNLEELLNFVPGFQSSREIFNAQGYRVGARGMLSPQPSYNILFLIDGQRINGDLAGGALFENRFITIANVERVEVIRGPGSALYGTSAYSGVVSITTKKTDNHIYLAKGNNGSAEIYGNFSNHVGDFRLSTFVRYYADNGDHYDAQFTTPINPNTVSTNDAYVGVDIAGTIIWQDNLTFGYRHMQRELSDFVIYRSLENGFTKAQTFQDFAYFELDTFKGDRSGLKTRLSILNGNVTTYEPFDEFRGRYEHQTSEVELSIDGHYLLGKHIINYGGSIRQAEVDKWQYSDFISQTIVPTGKPVDRDIIGVYVQDQYPISDNLVGTIGVRFDKITDIDVNINPRGSLVYTPSQDTALKLVYAEAFRAPNQFQTGDITLGNPNVIPEEIQTYEVIWMQDFRHAFTAFEKFQTTLGFFLSRHENRINIVPADTEYSLITKNDDAVLNTSGLEMEWLAKFNTSFSTQISFTQLFNTEQAPRSVPKILFQLLIIILRGIGMPTSVRFIGVIPSSLARHKLTILMAIGYLIRW